MGQVTLGVAHDSLTGLVSLRVKRRGQVDQEPVLQTDQGCWCCTHPGRQRLAAWSSRSEDRGTAENPGDPAVAELSLDGGSPGTGGEGLRKDIPQGFWLPADTGVEGRLSNRRERSKPGSGITRASR